MGRPDLKPCPRQCTVWPNAPSSAQKMRTARVSSLQVAYVVGLPHLHNGQYDRVDKRAPEGPLTTRYSTQLDLLAIFWEERKEGGREGVWSKMKDGELRNRPQLQQSHRAQVQNHLPRKRGVRKRYGQNWLSEIANIIKYRIRK